VKAELNETYGNTSSVDCPECGKPIRDLWDYGNDLVDGAEIECPHCEAKIKVVSVEIINEVTLREIAPTPEVSRESRA
jgi:DNA-directed RNA polymerase subunit RPC12/RpoP